MPFESLHPVAVVGGYSFRLMILTVTFPTKIIEMTKMTGMPSTFNEIKTQPAMAKMLPPVKE